ncbi:MAG: hypothetical protein JWM34_599 [Ilumatobacteraceae bacterium]|nr:hypothetical protein [Ilumatobacteraceae bacterium]
MSAKKPAKPEPPALTPGQVAEAARKIRQEKFCQLYVSEEFFGNGAETYLEVYDVDKTKKGWYQTACSLASRLLSNDKGCRRISDLLDEAGFNDAFADKQLLMLMTQQVDFKAKLGAIRVYNQLKRRIGKKITDPDGRAVYLVNMEPDDGGSSD